MPNKNYRVWTKDNGSAGLKVTCCTDWRTIAECKSFILARWGHYPPFAYISKAQSELSFLRHNGIVLD